MADAYDGTRAKLSKEAINDLVFSIYGLKVLSVKQLNGYEDQNFHITVDLSEGDSAETKLCELGYVFKVFNSLDSSKNSDQIYARVKLLEHLTCKGIPCPKVVRTKSGQLCGEKNLTNNKSDQIFDICIDYSTEDYEFYILELNRSHQYGGGDETSTRLHLIQLFEYIEGNTLDGSNVNPDIVYKGGVFLADLHLCMEGHVDTKLSRSNYIWSLSSLPKVRSSVHLVEDGKRRAIANEVLDKWESLQGVISTLPQAPIHADFNEQNILVKTVNGETKISGIIDFNDCDFNSVVFDVGIYMMYMMTCAADDPIGIAGSCLRGYLTKRQLSQTELEMVYYCTAGRLVQSLLIGLHYYSQRKDPYVLTTQKGGWRALEELWSRPPSEVLELWLSG